MTARGFYQFFGGGFADVVLAVLLQALQHADEMRHTLRFAQRAQRVVNNAVVNEVLSDAAMLKREARDIEQLRRKLGKNWCAVLVFYLLLKLVPGAHVEWCATVRVWRRRLTPTCYNSVFQAMFPSFFRPFPPTIPQKSTKACNLFCSTV